MFSSVIVDFLACIGWITVPTSLDQMMSLPAMTNS